MFVLPGTHKCQTYNHHDSDGYFCGAMDPDNCGVDFSKTIPCEGLAGLASFDKTSRLTTLRNNRSWRFSLTGLSNYGDFKNRLLFGEELIVPRFREVPVRMPLPPAKNQGSIDKNQTADNRFFGFVE
jgi:phytanoyl-CoA hydroxylase